MRYLKELLDWQVYRHYLGWLWVEVVGWRLKTYATDARLRYKPSLNKIRLTYSKKFDESRTRILELDVLDALKPHESLSSLEIELYVGAKFSSWIGDLSFSKLTKISFKLCENCTNLIALGHLPSLKDLNIWGMYQVKVIGSEFYENIC